MICQVLNKGIYNKSVEFSDWINQKYREWRGDAIGHERTQKDFAEWLGISNSLLTYWRQKNGKIPKHKSSIDKLVKRFGPEVYEVLQIDPPDISSTAHLPRVVRDRLEGALYETNAELASRGLSSSDPEAVEITIRIFEKHGFRYTKTSRD